MERNHISAWWLKSISAILAISPLPIVLWFQDYLMPHLEKLQTLTTLRIISILLITVTSLLAFIILNHPWLSWDEPTGTWSNRFNKTRYCANCKAKKNTVPLKNEITGWRCMHCLHWFNDPLRIIKESKPKVKNDRI